MGLVQGLPSRARNRRERCGRCGRCGGWRPRPGFNGELRGFAGAPGLPGAGYWRVRQFVLDVSEQVELPTWGELLLDVDFRVRSPMVPLDKLGGT